MSRRLPLLAACAASAAVAAAAAAAAPFVTKLGVYDYMTEESTPVIFNGRLLMLESVPKSYPGWAGNWLPAFANCGNYLRVRDMRSLAIVVNITLSCDAAFGAAVVYTDSNSGVETLLVSATPWDRSVSPWLSAGCGGAAPNCTVLLFVSASPGLEDASWSAPRGVQMPAGTGVYNTDIMQVPAPGMPFRWAMALETTRERARFAISASEDPTDGNAWRLLDANHTVPPLPDTGSCPSLRHDGEFFYYLTGGTDIHILRSRDLISWAESTSLVLRHSDPGDCVVAPSFFGPYVPEGVALQHLQTCGAQGDFGDDSDVDLVEWPAPFGAAGSPPAVLIEYGSGDQRTFGFSNLAFFNGTMVDFLHSFF